MAFESKLYLKKTIDFTLLLVLRVCLSTVQIGGTLTLADLKNETKPNTP